jgi:6-pyruvoyltetrahydropterin/6-carboxytetrahydropterin synthase
LHSEKLSEAENQRTFGKCNNPYGHGHDYVLDVSVTGEINPTTGLIVRLSLLDKLVADQVLTAFGHRNLNEDVAEFTLLVPTTENMALVIAKRLRSRWADYFPYSVSAQISGISIHETDRNSFEVLLPGKSLRLQAASSLEMRVPATSVDLNESVTVNV